MNNTNSTISNNFLPLAPFIGLVIAIIGWFIIAWLNRRNEIAKKRIDFILPMYHKYIEIVVILSKNIDDIEIFLKLVREVRVDFQLYGKKDEHILYEKFIQILEDKNLTEQERIVEIKNNLNPQTELIRKRIRKELNIKK